VATETSNNRNNVSVAQLMNRVIRDEIRNGSEKNIRRYVMTADVKESKRRGGHNVLGNNNAEKHNGIVADDLKA